jgi:UDP-2-acetamido-2,6-beta-L-arabino-hexul-4-ose reductase
MSLLRIAVMGAEGFIGRNLMLRLAEMADLMPVPITRSTSEVDFQQHIASANAVINLAGVNRPLDPQDFMPGNLAPVEQLITVLESLDRSVPVIHISSAKAVDASPYGKSKRAAEEALLAFAKASKCPVYIYRLPNVFGKWCKPDYNSAVATFCHNIARDLPITINDRTAALDLVYIDDVIDSFIVLLTEPPAATGFYEVQVTYQSTVGEIADIIARFRQDRDDNLIETVGIGLTRALYATYVASLPPHAFAYEIASHRDPRGAFSEFLKTRSSGQFSYFNALPGVTRGGHYHHSKTEKFLIVHGKARFGFRHMITGETHEIITSAETPVVVETVPGWTHDVTNIGEGVMVSLLWANEIFDRTRPDTIAEKV